MFESLASHAGVHQLRRRFAEDGFAMRRYVIGMGVADEDALGTKPRLVRIEPQAKLRQVNGTALKLDVELGHKPI